MSFFIRKEWFGGLIGDTKTYNLRAINPFTYKQLSTTSDILKTPKLKFELETFGFPTSIKRYKIFNNVNESILNQKILSAPIISWLEISSKCNLSCLHCFSDKKLKKNIEITDIITNINNLAKSGTFKITLTGGEAIAHKNIAQILSTINKHGIGLRIFSNGCLDQSYYDKIKNRNIDILFISLDGAENNNDYLRGKNTFVKAIKTIEYISSNIPSVNEIVLSYTLTKSNLKDLDEIYNICKENGIQTILMRPLMMEKNNIPELQELCFNKKEIYDALNELNDFSDKYNIEYQINKIPFINLKKNFYMHDSPQNIHLDSFLGINSIECVGGKSVCGIKADGRIIPCGFINLNYKDINYPNCQNYKEENWTQSHNLSLMRNITPNSTCQKCPALFLCNGGCRANTSSSKGSNIGGIDDFCIFQDTRFGKSLTNIETIEAKLAIYREQLHQSRERFYSGNIYISEYNIVSKCGWAGGSF